MGNLNILGAVRIYLYSIFSRTWVTAMLWDWGAGGMEEKFARAEASKSLRR